MRYPMWIIALALTPACMSRPTLSPAAGQVQLMKGDPPPGCRELGTAMGTSMRSAGSVELPMEELEFAKVDLRNKAAEMGANYVRMDAAAENGTTISGPAYRCEPANARP